MADKNTALLELAFFFNQHSSYISALYIQPSALIPCSLLAIPFHIFQEFWRQKIISSFFGTRHKV